MRRIYDFYRHPPKVGAVIVMLPVYDRGDDEDWAWFELAEGEPIPAEADDRYTQVYDGHHAKEDDTMRDDLIREYFEVEQSLEGPDDKEGLRLLEDAWRQMTPAEQAEVRRLRRQPCRGYGR